MFCLQIAMAAEAPDIKIESPVRKRQLWSKEHIERALEDIKGGMAMRRASSLYGIPYATLHDWNRRGSWPQTTNPTSL